MRKILVFTAVLFIANTTLVSAQKYKQDFNNTISIVFPDTPKITTLTRGVLFTAYVVKKEPNSFGAVITKLDTAALPMKTDGELTSLYKGIISGATNDTANVKVLYEKDISIAGHKAIDFKMINTKNAQKPTSLYQRAVYIEPYIYMFVYSTTDDSDQNHVSGSIFLDSVSVIKQ